jgi:hypothetical protein
VSLLFPVRKCVLNTDESHHCNSFFLTIFAIMLSIKDL